MPVFWCAAYHFLLLLFSYLIQNSDIRGMESLVEWLIEFNMKGLDEYMQLLSHIS
jgi:hypothetical protein